MTCARVSELLAAFADGGLEGREHDAVAAHVAGCAACTGEVRALREVLAETRRAGSPAPPKVDDVEAFWTDLARDIRVAVAADPAPRTSFWRMAVLGFGFAAALAAVLYVYAAGRPAVVATPRHHGSALPATPNVDDVDDLDADQLAALNAALSEERGEPDDDELAVSAPGAPENFIQNLSDDDASRVRASL